MKKIFLWLFEDFAFRIYQLAENKFTSHVGANRSVVNILFSDGGGGAETRTTATVTEQPSPNAGNYPTPPVGGSNVVAGMVCAKVTDTLGRVAYGYFWKFGEEAS